MLLERTCTRPPRYSNGGCCYLRHEGGKVLALIIAIRTTNPSRQFNVLIEGLPADILPFFSKYEQVAFRPVGSFIASESEKKNLLVALPADHNQKQSPREMLFATAQTLPFTIL